MHVKAGRVQDLTFNVQNAVAEDDVGGFREVVGFWFILCLVLFVSEFWL